MQTPLNLALANENFKFAEKLIDLGAIPSINDKRIAFEVRQLFLIFYRKIIRICITDLKLYLTANLVIQHYQGWLRNTAPPALVI